MPGSTHLSTQEADDLLRERKVITANLYWRPEGRGFKLEATVLSIVSSKPLKLHGYVGPVRRSLALLFQSVAIRRLCIGGSHRNPDGNLIRGLHKHLYDDQADDRIAYIPQDINEGNINNEFMDFLRECSIVLEGTYQSLQYP